MPAPADLAVISDGLVAVEAYASYARKARTGGFGRLPVVNGTLC